MTGCNGHVVNGMFGWRADGRFLKIWIYLWSFITFCDATGMLEIRFDQYDVTYTRGGQHVGVDPATVSMATSQIWEEVTPSTPPESSNTTTTAPNLPTAWQQSPVCSSPTRYRFLICMDLVGRPEQCALGREDSGLLQVTQGMVGPTGDGHDIVVFGNMLRGMPTPLNNPIIYNFPTWPGAIQVNAYVQCCGAADTERCEEKLSGNMAAIPVTTPNASPTKVNITNQGSAALTLSVTVRCSPNFYGVNCSTFCRNDNQLNDRVCHPVTGQLVCRPGFTGTNCDEDLNECNLGVCRHGAGCNNLHGTFTCHCLKGSTGRLCEVRTPACPSNPCYNGGRCEENMESVNFRCMCREGWTGKRCETVIPPTTTPSERDVKVAKVDEPKGEPEPTGGDWTIWYVGIALLALTVIVIIILIICVVWSSRRRRYHLSELAKPVSPIATVTTPSPQSQFDNIVYLHDPEDIDLQPPTSNLYQRTLVPDDPYMNERPLYQDRITPDTPYDENDICVSRRQGVSSKRENVYSTWGGVSRSEEAYESINVNMQEQRDSKNGIPPTDTSPTYRRESDPVPYSIFDFCNPSNNEMLKFDCFDNPNSTNDNVVSEDPQYDILLPMTPSGFQSDHPITQSAPQPIPDRRLSSQSNSNNDVQNDRRPSTVSSTVPADSQKLPENSQISTEPPCIGSSNLGSSVLQEGPPNDVAMFPAVYNPDYATMQPILPVPQPVSGQSHKGNEIQTDRHWSPSTEGQRLQESNPSKTTSYNNLNNPNSSKDSVLPGDPQYDTLVPFDLNHPVKSAIEPIYNPAFSTQSQQNTDVQSGRRASAISSAVSTESRRSSQPQQDTSPPTDDHLMTYANPVPTDPNRPAPEKVHAPNTSFKRPCPTPRTSLLVTEDPSTNARRESDTPSSSYIGKRRKSGDLLARTSSGSLQPDWPAENGKSKTGKYNLSGN